MRPGEPHPIGYVEIQRGWVGQPDGNVLMLEAAMQEIELQMQQEHPDLVHVGSRMEVVQDGAGVSHFNLYAGYAPKLQTTEPLDPRNLNAAQNANTTVNPLEADDPARTAMLGHKEQRF